jgi:hypothetical protein
VGLTTLHCKNNLVTKLNMKPRQVKEDEMGRPCSTNGDKRNAYRILGNPEGKRPLGRPKRRWVDNIKMDLREIG